ncbi:MAG TPA: TMEM175 family protein [Methylocystis sp.]|nr:TMEM175 family protein [Methylocystis sp.]
MDKNRLTAFSDGVFAIIITIMVLQLKAPENGEWRALAPLAPTFLAYALSFAYVAIYWNNHHHLLQATRRVSGGILWANMLLLFGLSLVPFSTAWLSAAHFAAAPATLYGLTLLAPGVADYFLSRLLISSGALHEATAQAIGSDRKARVSLLLYAVGVGLASFAPWVAIAIYGFVATLWLVPDRRIEDALRVAKEQEFRGGDRR